MPDYPLAENAPERLRTPSGLAFEDITLEAVLAGEVEMRDLRVTSEALELQPRSPTERDGRNLPRISAARRNWWTYPRTGSWRSIKPFGPGEAAGRRYSSWRTIWRTGGKRSDVPRW
jgi:hypothetical protein